MTRPYAEVIGDPIAQSKSPLIHGFWLGKLGIEADYRACHVRDDELTDYFDSRRADPHWRGCNVTIPHKLAVLALIGDADEAARSVGAANTVYRHAGRLLTTNTDIDGILGALPEDLMPPGAQACIFGTGGAARAAYAACQRRGVSHVRSSARNLVAGRDLLSHFRLDGQACLLDDADNIQTSQVIINATSLGMVGQQPMPQAVLEHLRRPLPEAVVFDMVYAPLETELLKAGRAAGLRVVDGLAMLIGQAAVAFERFFGRSPPREHDDELRAVLTA